jgi:hypothetical protein
MQIRHNNARPTEHPFKYRYIFTKTKKILTAGLLQHNRTGKPKLRLCKKILNVCDWDFDYGTLLDFGGCSFQDDFYKN